MLKKSIVAVKTEIGYQYIHCTFSGFDDDFGLIETLSRYYKGDKALQLICQGNIYNLIQDKSTPYLKEKWNGLQIASNINELKNLSTTHQCDFLYIYDDKWKMYYN